MAAALGFHAGSPAPETNHAVTARTEGDPGPNHVQFETVTPIPLPTSDRFLTFSVDAAETNCHANHALFEFYLVDGAAEHATFTRPIEPCVDPAGSVVSIPGLGTFVLGTFAADRAVLFSGSAVGIRMRNAQGSGAGNDAAFDNIRVLDATPQLDKAFSPAVLDVGQVTPGRFVNGPDNIVPRGVKAPAETSVHFRAADVSVAKRAIAQPAVPGAEITYELVVTNAGPDPAPNVTVSDTLPTGLAFASASPGCASSGQTVTCAVDSLAVGASQTFTVTATVASALGGGTLENTATVASDLPDPEPSNNSSTTTVPVEPRADLAIVKRALSDRPVPGRELTYELVVTNDGPSPARDIRVSDPLPRGLSFVSAADGCAFADGTVTCALDALPAGEAVTFTVVTSVARSLTGRIVNVATVDSSTPDPDPSDNRDRAQVPSKPEADLSIRKIPSVTSVPAGGQLFYTLLIRNHGPSDARDVVVTDEAGGGLTLLSAQGGPGVSCVVATPRVTCRLDALAAGGTTQVLVSARADHVGELANQAAVDSATDDPDPRDNRDRRRIRGTPPPVTAPQPADLEIVKTANRSAITGTGAIRYTLRVRNLGPGTAQGVQLLDTPNLPIRVRSVTSSAGRCSRRVPIRCDLGTLGPGARATVRVVAEPRAPGVLRNSASVTGDAPDPRAENNVDGTSARVRGLLKVSKAASATRVSAGGRLRYRIAVTNASPFALRRVRVCDALPAGLVFVSARPRARLSGGRRCWTVRRLGARKSRRFVVDVRVLGGASGRKVNVATATAPNARGARGRAATAKRPVQVIAGQVRGGGVTG